MKDAESHWSPGNTKWTKLEFPIYQMDKCENDWQFQELAKIQIYRNSYAPLVEKYIGIITLERNSANYGPVKNAYNLSPTTSIPEKYFYSHKQEKHCL